MVAIYYILLLCRVGMVNPTRTLLNGKMNTGLGSDYSYSDLVTLF